MLKFDVCLYRQLDEMVLTSTSGEPYDVLTQTVDINHLRGRAHWERVPQGRNEDRIHKTTG